eukprot:TRINITY_DN4774_c0_g1_i1.p4 TRINITY_DN4774_c0_g1~~TRINITY_DN4774_c0_g1_i1.p4  ORF type:complete len:100 (+),score=36.62 TRINITY_DN4774_c0_g1_i1:301-600(+)
MERRCTWNCERPQRHHQYSCPLMTWILNERRAAMTGSSADTLPLLLLDDDADDEEEEDDEDDICRRSTVAAERRSSSDLVDDLDSRRASMTDGHKIRLF